MTKCGSRVVEHLTNWVSLMSGIISPFFFPLSASSSFATKVVPCIMAAEKLLALVMWPHHSNFLFLMVVMWSSYGFVWWCLTLHHLWCGQHRRCLGGFCSISFLVLGFFTVSYVVPISKKIIALYDLEKSATNYSEVLEISNGVISILANKCVCVF